MGSAQAPPHRASLQAGSITTTASDHTARSASTPLKGARRRESRDSVVCAAGRCSVAFTMSMLGPYEVLPPHGSVSGLMRLGSHMGA